MIELEVLVEVLDDINKVMLCLNEYKFLSKSYIIDYYYYDPLRYNLLPYKDNKLYSSFRLRNKNDKYYLTYKNDNYSNGIWVYSDEYETEVSNYENIKKIIYNLGLKPLLTLNSKKLYYSYKNYEVTLEIVDDLGIFLEVELKLEITKSEVNYYKKEINNFISNLGITVTKELNSGKPELYIARNGINI